MESEERIYHSCHSYQCEEACGDAANGVAKVEKSHGETTEDDSEVQPGEERSFVGEKHFGLDARGQSYPLAWRKSVLFHIREGQIMCTIGSL